MPKIVVSDVLGLGCTDSSHFLLQLIKSIFDFGRAVAASREQTQGQQKE